MTDRFRAIGAFLLVGSGWGLLVTLAGLASAPASPRTWISVALGLLVFGFFAWAGWRLWQQHPSGAMLGLLALALQIPLLDLPAARYAVHAPAMLGFSVGAGFETTLDFSVGAVVQVAWWPDSWRSMLGINVLALALWIWLYRAAPSEVPAAAGASSAP